MNNPSEDVLRKLLDHVISGLNSRYAATGEFDKLANEQEFAVSRFFRKYLRQISIRSLSEVTRRVVDGYLAWRAEGGYTRTVKKHGKEVTVSTKIRRKTINTELTVLRELFNRAMDWNYMVVNPTRGMKKLPLTDATPARVLSREELSRVCAHAQEPYRTMFRIYAGTGLRLSELQNARREDIDLKRELRFVRSRPDTLTKTGTDRVVPIPTGLLPAFAQVIERTEGEFPFRHENGVRGQQTGCGSTLNGLRSWQASPTGSDCGFMISGIPTRPTWPKRT